MAQRPGTVTKGKARRLAAWTAVSLSAVMLVAACGDSKKSTSAKGASSTKGGTEKADSSLAPVLIGFINQEAGASGAYPQPHVAAQSAVDYINNELGGV